MSIKHLCQLAQLILFLPRAIINGKGYKLGHFISESLPITLMLPRMDYDRNSEGTLSLQPMYRPRWAPASATLSKPMKERGTPVRFVIGAS